MRERETGFKRKEFVVVLVCQDRRVSKRFDGYPLGKQVEVRFIPRSSFLRAVANHRIGIIFPYLARPNQQIGLGIFN